MNRTVCCLLALLLLLPLQGCKFKDIDLKLFVIAVGIDESESNPDKLNVTLKIAVPQGDPKKAEQQVQIMTQEGDTLAETIREMKSRTDKELDFGHCKAILFGEKYARKNILQSIDWLMRRRDLQLTIYTAVAKPSAKEVLNVQPVTERIPANSILLALSKEGTESPFIVPPAFSYILQRRVDEIGVDPILALVEKKSENEFLINKSYMFDKSKAIAVLEPEETRIYNLLKTKNLKTSFNVDYEGLKYAYNIEGSRAKYKIITPKNSTSYIEYRIKISAEIEESQNGVRFTAGLLDGLSEAAGEQLSERVKRALSKIHQSKCDPLGWGLHYYATHWNNSTEQKDWEDLNERLEFRVKSDVKIKFTGTIR
ncbi:Ger(x)C family spore germination protein [Paenibacillus sp. YPG26]|uniref:Ger(x)C family spore germination protein n=1 Tax=Paenibacillus sp. YPG26 TaxID=2878915 RepID=UPI00203CB417|nr:Ger(x)C family spore germination protein [Paenibacillus sp. YPG26]USB34000.1 Ger(x)C family spore germination protein [Paenibacillus sp. YPG26]